MEIKFTKEETLEIKNTLVQFYEGLDTIKDYFLIKKLESVNDVDTSFLREHLFNDHTLPPNDYKISLEVMENKKWFDLVSPITSMPLESQIGRRLLIGVKEMTTDKYLGFIRLASPILSIKPRTNHFNSKIGGKDVNRHMINGSVIVPTQPFGYNCLGGKLLALISCSHEVKDLFNKQYGTKSDVIWWETTSLYGSIKGVSQYDGLKPFIRYGDLTESDLLIYPTNEIYKPMLNRFREIWGHSEWGNRLVEPTATGPKLREFNKLISILKHHLGHYDVEELNSFNKFIKEKMKSKTQKRFYYSNYGYSNVVEHINSNGDIGLIKGENYDKHNLDYMVDWWKNKAQKRWDKLNDENTIRTELEFYTVDRIKNEEIDMIR